uniref:Uncharacterized protein n=1 Tax=Tanacetum cinerariifolium TaxID=118510 RepID=A0A6L2JI71_TANCI|nr:hypothetical protein [Tanacetum cinerariifolium]
MAVGCYWVDGCKHESKGEGILTFMGLTLVGTETLTLLGERLLLGDDCKRVRLEKLSSDDDSRLMSIISHPHAGFNALLVICGAIGMEIHGCEMVVMK